MGIIGWTLFGIVVALFARAVMPQRYPLGMFGTTSLAVVGALVAGWFGESAGWYTIDEGLGFVVATLGAIATLAVYHGVVGKRAIRQFAARGFWNYEDTRKPESKTEEDKKKAA